MPPKKDDDKKNGGELSVEDRLDRIEQALGLGAGEAEPTDAVPGEPLKVHQLYAPATEEEQAALAKEQEAATKAAANA